MSVVYKDDDIQEYLDSLFAGSSCSWCKDHNRRLYGKRLPLCGSCRRINQSIRRYERLVSEQPPRPPRSVDHNRFDLAVAKRMKDLAIQDGELFGDINTQPLDELDLEHIFVEVSKIAVKRELFDNWATLLGHSFTAPQRRLLFYMLSQIVRAHRCKHRTLKASYSLPDDWDET